ncbi:MAG: hypothetical protein PHS41_04430 [Victivallaceae bacterium]|nr:hypothetical protein [Victivallaceae bacterium]
MVVTAVSIVVFKSLGVGNDALAFWSSLLNLPWVCKPLWTPAIDVWSTKRNWVAGTEFLIAAGFFLAGFALTGNSFFLPFTAVLFLIAFASATHDAAADGFYILALTAHRQAFFSGIRSTFYRFAMIAASGGLVMFGGMMGEKLGMVSAGWRIAFLLAGCVFLCLACYHFIMLPRCEVKQPCENRALPRIALEFGNAFVSFFRRKNVFRMIAFLLLYRFAEAQLGRLSVPFLLDAPEVGGLGYSPALQGFLYGTVGVLALLAGGVLGGVVISRFGMGKLIWPMAMALNLPDVLYLAMSVQAPATPWIAAIAIAIEQAGYGFGFTLYMLAMVAYADQGENQYKTSHFALMTGFMALGMMLPGLWAGKIQLALGYRLFFLWVMLATIPATASVLLLRGVIAPSFGKKQTE